jgi:hypothetical protein
MDNSSFVSQAGDREKKTFLMSSSLCLPATPSKHLQFSPAKKRESKTPLGFIKRHKQELWEASDVLW